MASSTRALAPDVGSRAPWVRDLSLLGGATGVGAPLAALAVAGMVDQGPASLYLATAGMLGLVSGAALGALTPRLVAWRLGRMPRLAFLAVGLGVGALWAAAVGAAAGWVAEPGMGLWARSAWVAAPVGAVQLGWFWLWAAGRRVRRRPVAGLLAGAALVAPLLGLAVGFALG